MIRKFVLPGFIIAILTMSLNAWSQDPGLPDSMIIGNLDRSLIAVAPNEQIAIPVWLKTDDSVTFVHIPAATNNDYIASRNGGQFHEPLSLWDDRSFLTINANAPRAGYSSQSILGFAYLMDPRDPQNFLMTGYQWVHIADFALTTTSDNSVMGDTTCLIEGRNPANGGLLMGLQDGITAVIPATIYTCLVFSPSDVKETGSLPDKASLLGAYPNPFNSSTSVKFVLPSMGNVSIVIYNVNGQKVRIFKLSNQRAGEGSVTWDGADKSGKPVASGVYVIEMKAGEFKATSRVTLIK